MAYALKNKGGPEKAKFMVNWTTSVELAKLILIFRVAPIIKDNKNPSCRFLWNPTLENASLQMFLMNFGHCGIHPNFLIQIMVDTNLLTFPPSWKRKALLLPKKKHFEDGPVGYSDQQNWILHFAGFMSFEMYCETPEQHDMPTCKMGTSSRAF